MAEPGQHVGVSQAVLVAMRDEMESRGPDGAGILEHRNVAMGHRLLAIRDVTGGNQPWISEDGRYALIYNGEIYNDRELREELTRQGHTFRSRCDTEVVMEAYRRWGNQCVEHLRGMFAFGVYDFHTDRLMLARDRFGIKPLFFTTVNGVLIFASSIAAILRHPHVSRNPNFQTISHYLTTFRITLGRQTMFAGIEQLQPGEILTWNRGDRLLTRYWELPHSEEQQTEYTDAADELDSILCDSVDRRMISDVPVGAFLSGGVDSNSILASMPHAQSRGLKTFCGGGAGDSPDFEYAARCSQHFHSDYEAVHVSQQEYLEAWQQLVTDQHLPLSTPTDVILNKLSQRMKESVGVALGGEGADELLCGYAVQHWSGQDYDTARSLQRGRWNGTLPEARQFTQSQRQQYGRETFASESEHFLSLNSLIPHNAKPHLLQPWAWEQAGSDEPIIEFYDALFAERGEESTTRKHAAVIHRVNLEGLLSRLDSSTMAAGLEARVPFTDHILVERMFGLPMHYKIDVAPHEHKPHLASSVLQQRGSLRSKRLLRTVAQRRLPAELAERKKASFPTPVADWFGGEWETWTHEKLLGSPFARTLFQPTALRELTENPQAAGMWLWPVVNLALWGDREFAAA